MNYNKRIILSLVFMCILFLSIIAYLTYFEFFMKESIVANNYNQRHTQYQEDTIRGSFYDRNGTILAYSELDGDEQIRIYPYANLYSHVIGYSSLEYRDILLEGRYSKYLTGQNEWRVIADLKNRVTGEMAKGNDITITIDNELQELGSKLLNGNTGAIIAMNPKTGEILAQVSKPDFDPSEESLIKNWNDLEESILLPRTTQGLYEPGSTFKVLITAVALENNMEDLIIEDNGEVIIEGRSIKNYNSKAYGTIGIKDALVHSSNVFFSQVAVQLGYEQLKDIALRAGFNKDIPFDLSVKISEFPYDKNMSVSDMMDVGIGQGEIQVTPLHMAMIASSIANNGIMMEPFVVSKVESSSGLGILEKKYKTIGEIMSQENAEKITEMMKEVVDSGTGQQASIKGISVAGKTGTAETQNEDTGKEHAWFIGFAPAEDPQIAVAVIVEYVGATGGEKAAPIAREIMSNWLK